MVNNIFIGREKELARLKALSSKKSANFVVIKGRRRIGKSRLIEEFAKGQNFLSLTGLAPTPNTTAQSQRKEFARQMSEQLKLPELAAHDWGDLFQYIAQNTQNKKIIILFDEISWMGSKDPDFLGKLKIAWDQYFSKNTKLILVICGSVSSWIDKNIISSTGFFGRIAQKITLEPLSIQDSNKLLAKRGFRRSVYEKCLILSMTGGVPWYLELINPAYSANKNIQELCFNKDGILFDEFRLIFHDLFGRRGSIYQSIVQALQNGAKEFDQIAEAINYSASGQLSEYLDELIQAGFLSRDYTWHLKNKKLSKLSKYRISDNFIRFYLRLIQPNTLKIERNLFEDVDPLNLPGFDSVMGLQFESLVLNNSKDIFKTLNLSLNEVEIEGPFFQRRTQSTKGCQIDYLIQTKHNSLYLIEIKFSRNKLDKTIIQEVEHKINQLSTPRNMAVLPVLIHMNGVNKSVLNSDYFYQVIDFTEYLKS